MLFLLELYEQYMNSLFFLWRIFSRKSFHLKESNGLKFYLECPPGYTTLFLPPFLSRSNLKVDPAGSYRPDSDNIKISIYPLICLQRRLFQMSKCQSIHIANTNILISTYSI